MVAFPVAPALLGSSGSLTSKILENVPNRLMSHSSLSMADLMSTRPGKLLLQDSRYPTHGQAPRWLSGLAAPRRYQGETVAGVPPS